MAEADREAVDENAGRDIVERVVIGAECETETGERNAEGNRVRVVAVEAVDLVPETGPDRAKKARAQY